MQGAKKGHIAPGIMLTFFQSLLKTHLVKEFFLDLPVSKEQSHHLHASIRHTDSLSI